MFAHTKTSALAGLLFMGIAVFGVKVYLWRTEATETPQTRQQDARKGADPGVEPAMATDKDNVPSGHGTRHEFARAMSKIKEGMPEKEVLALLGKPDDIRTHNDAGGISTTRTREIWRYGTNGHLTFPTLGCVCIDNEGKSQYAYGGRGEPPDPKLLSEAELRRLLRLIDKAASYNSGYHFDPLAMIQIVNALQPLGKDKALAAIDEYLRVASGFHSPGREGVFLVLRVLFDVPADPGHMPHMYVGAPSPPGPKEAKLWPRYPVLLQDDVPLLLVAGYDLSGVPEQPENHVRYFRENGRLRDKLLTPGNAPLSLMDSWAKDVGWLFEKDFDLHGRRLVANQLLNMVDSVYRRDTDAHGYKFWPKDDVDDQWKSIAAEVAKLEIRWNAEKNRFTFKDGSHLADPIPKLYRRHIWKLEGLNGESALILERTSNKYVWVILEWSGKRDQMPPFVLDLFDLKNKTNALAQMLPTSIGGYAGVEAFSSQSFHVELADGAEVQGRLTIGKSEHLSPVYRP